MGAYIVKTSSSIALLFMLYLELVALGTSTVNCPELSCGNQPIRFPFRIKGLQPPTCGYPGFDLSCSSNNQIVIELPHSVKLIVNNINYRHQTIELSDQQGCLYRQLHNLTLSSSHFQFNPDSDDLDGAYHFFNCSAMDRDSSDKYSVPCLSTPTSQVYAIPSYKYINDLPLYFCTKMFNISSYPSNFLSKHNFLHLTWSEPNCKHCESKGNRCTWKWENNTANRQIYCFPQNHKGSSTALVTTGSILGSLFFVLLIGGVFHIYDSYILKKQKQAIMEKFLKNYKALKPTRYSYAEIKGITNNFGDKLGQGAYGTVYKGSISKELNVAVKILNFSQGNGEDFVNEVGTMGRIHHLNIVRLVGFCADGFIRALVYEFLPNGSLQKFINSPDNKQNFLGWKRLHEIALGIAKGIEYLH